MVKRKPPLDEKSYRLVREILAAARWAGVDPIDLLYQRGFLLTPKVMGQIQGEAMDFLLREARRWTPAEFLRRKNRSLQNTTPTEMYYAILEWMEQHVQAAKDLK